MVGYLGRARRGPRGRPGRRGRPGWATAVLTLGSAAGDRPWAIVKTTLPTIVHRPTRLLHPDYGRRPGRAAAGAPVNALPHVGVQSYNDRAAARDRKSTRLNSSHLGIS